MRPRRLPGQGRGHLTGETRRGCTLRSRPPVREAAPAKLNLHLRVVGRRDDGYHLLDSLVAFAAVHDVIAAEPAETLSLSVDGPFAGALERALRTDGAENLALRAARLLAEAAGLRPEARITLTKTLPVAAGIGGGSADAAATLRALCALWRLDLSGEELRRLALPLGADLPACLAARPVLVAGIGERIEAVPPLPAAGLLLVNPGAPVATAGIFAARRGPFSAPAGLRREDLAAVRDAAALAGLLQPLGNDLATPAIAAVPAIAAILDRLAAAPDCLLARLSGSGATCFGLFPDEAAAETAAAAIAAEQPGWWVAPTRFLSEAPPRAG